jgi:hypothetical protein
MYYGAAGTASFGGGTANATIDGTVNTGGGGGGRYVTVSTTAVSGAGGSGIVIVRYTKSQVD